MSPEQARGKFVDQRTDNWAVGCLLFEMLTGQPAFGGEANQLGIASSPNGDAIAYFSNAPGLPELLVEPFPRDGSRVRISEQDVGSVWPVWSRDGVRLSYQLVNGGAAAVDLTVPGFGVVTDAVCRSPVSRFSAASTVCRTERSNARRSAAEPRERR